MEANMFEDESHLKAIRYCIKQALYNQALSDWQKNNKNKMQLPQPEDFSLSPQDIERKEQKALDQIQNYIDNKK